MRLSRTLVVLPLALWALLALPALAGARAYVVTSAAQLTSALSQASLSAEADTIDLAAGTYTGQFEYDGSSAVTITGAGQTATTLANGGGDHTALELRGSGSIVAQRLGVSVTGTNEYGLQLDNAGVVVQDVQLVDQPAATNANAVVAYAGTLRRATISGDFDRGVYAPDTGGTLVTVDGLTVAGGSDTTALEGEGTGTSMVASHVKASDVSIAAHASFGGALTVTDSLLEIGTGANMAAAADDNNNSAAFSSNITLARDTLVASARNQRGVTIAADRGDAMSATVTDTVMTGFATPLDCFATNGGSGTITSTNLAYDSGATNASECAVGAVRQAGTIVGDPQFVDPTRGNYRLRAGSPLIDVSDVASPGATDLDGHPRPADGNGDCVRRGDVGAYELLLPPSAGGVAVPAPAGAPVAFTAAPACDSGSASPLHDHWAFDDGASADGAVVAHAFSSAGTHSALLTVTDAEGQAAQATVSVVVSPKPPTPKPAAPAIGRFSAPSALTLGSGAPKLGGRRGHALTVQLTVPATVTLSATRLEGGRRARSGRCVSSARAPHGRRCTQRLPVHATARLRLPAGVSLIAFAGRMSAHAALAPGRYELKIVARDALGQTSRARTLDVTIRRAPARRRRRRR